MYKYVVSRFRGELHSTLLRCFLHNLHSIALYVQIVCAVVHTCRYLAHSHRYCTFKYILVPRMYIVLVLCTYAVNSIYTYLSEVPGTNKHYVVLDTCGISVYVFFSHGST